MLNQIGEAHANARKGGSDGEEVGEEGGRKPVSLLDRRVVYLVDALEQKGNGKGNKIKKKWGGGCNSGRG